MTKNRFQFKMFNKPLNDFLVIAVKKRQRDGQRDREAERQLDREKKRQRDC